MSRRARLWLGAARCFARLEVPFLQLEFVGPTEESKIRRGGLQGSDDRLPLTRANDVDEVISGDCIIWQMGNSLFEVFG